MRKIFLIFVSISILTLCISIISSARLPTVGGDSDQWGSVLNEFLNVSFNETGELRNDTISTNQIINGTITDTDISDTTNLTLGDKITFTFGEIIDNLVDGFIRITGNLRIEGIANFSGTLYINNATDVSVWMYNQTTATFNLYNSTWDNNWLTQMLSANDTSINTTANIQTLLIGTNISQYAFNQTLQTFNTYNSTWDNNWQVALLSANISSINTTNVHQQLLNNTNMYFNQLSIGTPNQVGQFYTVGSSYFNLTGAQNFSVINTTGTSLFHVNGTSGNVGIGTTSPAGKLWVDRGNISSTETIAQINLNVNGSSCCSRIGISDDGVLGGFLQFNNNVPNLFLTTSSGYNDFSPPPLYLGTNSTIRMAILGTGNVGIGTTSPASKLVVESSDANEWAMRIKNTHATAGYGLLVEAGDSSTETILFLKDKDSNNKFKFNPDGEAWCYGTDPCWNFGSSRELKKDIVKLNKGNNYNNILDEFKATPVYSFIRKDDSTNTTQIGLIAEDTPDLINAKDKTSLSAGAMANYLFVVDKAQQEEIDMLKSELCLKDKTYSWCK